MNELTTMTRALLKCPQSWVSDAHIQEAILFVCGSVVDVNAPGVLARYVASAAAKRVVRCLDLP